MAKYLIPNYRAEIIDPTIEVIGLEQGVPQISNPNIANNTYSVDIRLITPNGTKFQLTLNNVQAESLDFNSQGAKMHQQILDALNAQFLIVE